MAWLQENKRLITAWLDEHYEETKQQAKDYLDPLR